MRLYARTYKRLSLSLTNRASAMATKSLASKATVEQNVQVFFNRGFCLAISRWIFEQFWLRISCEIFRLFVGLGECTRMENWNMLFCITWSNAFQLPVWSWGALYAALLVFLYGAERYYTPPPPFFTTSHGTTEKTKLHDVEVARETSWPFFGFWTSGSDASGHGAQVPALL